MSRIAEGDRPDPPATDGEIATINLESARRRSWVRFAQDPLRLGLAEEIIDQERLVSQFLGDLGALDRLDDLAPRFGRVDNSFRAALIDAQVASGSHRFNDARGHLARAAHLGAPLDVRERHRLTIDQACGMNLETVFAARRQIAAATGGLEDLVPLGAVLADLERFAEANSVYRQAFYSYAGMSPFPPAWVCFQLGLLWGELVPATDPDLAALWYRRAISYVPGYVKARVHLAEILISQGQAREAEVLLVPALSSGDPEVRWRLASVLTVQERFTEAQAQLDAARLGFEELLRKHPLAFADHAAEFYAGSGDRQWALELARLNAANRPTRRSLELVHALVLKADETGEIPGRRIKPADRDAGRFATDFMAQRGSL